MRYAGTGLKTLGLLLLLATTAAAVQRVYTVAPDIIFLPLNGVALNAHTGHVAWRFPRYTGHTYTDGHGLLLLSWIAARAPHFHHYTTRICRVNTSDGHPVWCRDEAAVQTWVVDNTGQFLYLHAPGRLEIWRVADGRPDHGFSLNHDNEFSLMPLPATGVLMLERHHGHVTQAWRYDPGAVALRPVSVPADLYPFRGNGRGLLLYAKPKREFFLAAPFRRLFDRVRPQVGDAFPTAKLDDTGFFFTDWAGKQPVVRGGTYDGDVWRAPRRSSTPQLAITGSVAMMLETGKHASSQLMGWNLASGKHLYARTIPSSAGPHPRLLAGNGAAVVQTNSTVLLYNAVSGRQQWSARATVDALAAIAHTAVVFWDRSGHLIGLARNNGALLWRVRFQTVGIPLPF